MRPAFLFAFIGMAALFATTNFLAPDPAAIKIQGADTAGNPLQCIQVAPGQGNGLQTFVSATATGSNANQVATLPGVVGKTTYITGFSAGGAGATAGSGANTTVAGLLGGTLNFPTVFPAGVGSTITPLNFQFVPPMPASAVNTAIVVTMPAAGAGNTFQTCTAWGFQQ
jgi:hypothetical protein